MNEQAAPRAASDAVSRLGAAHRLGAETLGRTISASHYGILLCPSGEQGTGLLRATVDLLAAEDDGGRNDAPKTIAVVFDQWSGDPNSALLDAIAVAVDRATGTLVTRPNPDPRTLAEVIDHWADRFGMQFLIVLDRFDANLAAEPLDRRNAGFTEQLAAAIESGTDHLRFLIVVDPRQEHLLLRLSARLSRPIAKPVRFEVAPGRVAGPNVRPAPSGAPATTGAERIEERMPGGFSARGDGEIDAAATDAVLRRRDRQQRQGRIVLVGGIALVVAAAVAATAFVIRSRTADPGALLSRSQLPAAAEPEAHAPAQPIRPAEAVPERKAESVEAKPVEAGAPPAPAGTREAAPTAASGAENAPAPITARTEPSLPGGEPTASKPAASDTAPAADGARSPEAAATAAPAPAPSAPAERIPVPEKPAAPQPPAPIDAARNADPGPERQSPPEPQPRRPAAFGIDAAPEPPIPERLVRGIPNPERGPMLFLHIRSESQRGKAREMERGLARMGIAVSGIRVDERGPLKTDLRYFRSAEKDEATYLGKALGRFGMAPARTTLVSGHEGAAARRHYELWFAPPPGR